MTEQYKLLPDQIEAETSFGSYTLNEALLVRLLNQFSLRRVAEILQVSDIELEEYISDMLADERLEAEGWTKDGLRIMSGSNGAID